MPKPKKPAPTIPRKIRQPKVEPPEETPRRIKTTPYRRRTELVTPKRSIPNIPPVYKTPKELSEKYPNLDPYIINDPYEQFEENMEPMEYDVSHMGYEKEEEEDQEEVEDEEEEEDNLEEEGDIAAKERQGFSLSDFLTDDEEVSKSGTIFYSYACFTLSIRFPDQLRTAISTGSAFDVGHCIRDGFKKKTLTELQLEVC
uniref:Protein TsetseEP-like n=1 Tax=Caenorhabditis tropicalis TaxID=1561998 RepID=A0A1I7UK63_9PELO